MSEVHNRVLLSVVIPCYNEKSTLAACVEAVLSTQTATVSLEIIIVDDGSADGSRIIAEALAARHGEVKALAHPNNRGKGAALRTGFGVATGDYVVVQDADLEYDPRDLLQLIAPLRQGKADVVLGSRFATGGEHRVLYFWHSVGNRLLTLLSNMFTDLNLTDMETCYKVFRREVIQSINIQESRFGFEPEVVAKVAAMHCRVYEMGISYHGRTYAEGKKIGLRDGFRAVLCILRYNSGQAPAATQFIVYCVVGAAALGINLIAFASLRAMDVGVFSSTVAAFLLLAALTYALRMSVIFGSGTGWRVWSESVVRCLVTVAAGAIDAGCTLMLCLVEQREWICKIGGFAMAFGLHLAGRQYRERGARTCMKWRGGSRGPGRLEDDGKSDIEPPAEHAEIPERGEVSASGSRGTSTSASSANDAKTLESG